MDDLACAVCDLRGVRLWREYSTFIVELRCRRCLPAEARDALDSGTDPTQAAWWVCAVPTGDTYWGYTSIPQPDLERWLALPG